MDASNAENNGSEKTSSKKLVRILVIVGIGIPVLVEVLTLFNLINVQLFEEEKQANTQVQPVEEVREFGEGDTLFADLEAPVVINQLKIDVSAQQWSFSLGLADTDTAARKYLPNINIDSLKLRSGQILKSNQDYSWQPAKNTKPQILSRWTLPNGDIPATVFISSWQPVSADSIRRVQRKIKLGNIPIRYARSSNQ